MMRWRLLRLAFVSSFCFLSLVTQGSAHVPVPDSVLNPRTAPEAWNVIRLSTANVEQLLRENRLAEITDQISLCSPALRTLKGLVSGAAERQTQAAGVIVRASVAVSSLAQASQAGDKNFAETTQAQLRAALRELAAFFDPAAVAAEIYFCPMHPDFCSADPAARCDKCGMNLLQRRIPYSFIYVPPGEPSVRLTARTDNPLMAGKEAHVTVRLSHRDDSPVVLSDLLVMHTQPIHLLIVNSGLDDYHHEHPTPTDTPGEYVFSFTPATNAGYRIFADLTPAANGVQEYTFADLPGAAPNPLPASGANTFSAQAGGLHFQLDLEGSNDAPLQTRQARSLRVTVHDAAGKPVQGLEPVMNAFSHLVGFYDDSRTVVHLHPAGGEITNTASRGGPSLDFKFYPPKSGFIRLYCQVLVGGRMIFAPFNVDVAP